MVERAEQQLESWIYRVRFAALARLHPELRALRDERERVWALWFAAEGAPTWWRWMTIIVILLAPALIALAMDAALAALGGALPISRAFNLVVLWLAGMLGAAWMIELARRARVRTRCLLAMRISGHDVCPGCGYSMVGHEIRRDRLRTCPECGGDVPPPPSMALTRVSRG